LLLSLPLPLPIQLKLPLPSSCVWLKGTASAVP
jgi:hypothetical protein